MSYPPRAIVRNKFPFEKSDDSRASRGQVIYINMLPDDILLAVFDFCADEHEFSKTGIEAWQSLVHICRRWRTVVFGSPRRLNLRLVCTGKTPVRDTLDVWPPLPLAIHMSLTKGWDNLVVILERRDRVDEIELFQVDSSLLKMAAMQEPFPELEHLRLWSRDEIDETVRVIPDSFLGGSAPRLVYLLLDRIPFPGLPNLLLSATHLVYLQLSNIPHSGYISPATMVMALSTLTSLKSFRLEFQSPRSHPDLASRRQPPPMRSVLPTLTEFWFKGVCEYLDDLVAGVDAPRLNKLYITFFNDIVFDTPQFIQFISRAPTLEALENSHVVFNDRGARVNFPSQTSDYRVEVSCRELGWQVSSLEQVCTLCLPPLSSTEDLYIYQDPFSQLHLQDKIENSLWLELLHPFSAVKSLYLSKEFGPRIVAALQELVGGRTTDVLPALQYISLEELQCPGRHWEACCCATALRSYYNRFPLGKRPEAGPKLVFVLGG